MCGETLRTEKIYISMISQFNLQHQRFSQRRVLRGSHQARPASPRCAVLRLGSSRLLLLLAQLSWLGLPQSVSAIFQVARLNTHPVGAAAWWRLRCYRVTYRERTSVNTPIDCQTRLTLSTNSDIENIVRPADPQDSPSYRGLVYCLGAVCSPS